MFELDIDLVVFVELFEFVVDIVSVQLDCHHGSMDCTEWNERETNQDEVQCCRPLSIYFLLITHDIYIIIIVPLSPRETSQVDIYIYICIYIIVNEIYRNLLDELDKNKKRGSDVRRQLYLKHIIVVD